jgi:putative hydrolase of the HAD superfamily
MSLRAVLFDAGNTLLSLEYDRLARRVGQAVGRLLTARALELAEARAAQVLERRDGRDRERASRYLETLFLEAGVPAGHRALVRATLLQLHRERHLWSRAAPGAEPALVRLAAAGLRLGVVSNSDGRCEEALVTAGLRAHFDVVIDSDVVGVEKPDPAIFAAALGALGVAPGEALYVGDVYEVDVVGARGAGLEAILLDPLGRHAGRDVRTARDIPHAAELILNGQAAPPARIPTPDA